MKKFFLTNVIFYGIIETNKEPYKNKKGDVTNGGKENYEEVY